MSERQEFHAPTVQEAVDKASTSLGVAREQMSFEVLDQGSTGFLGIGARDARIMVEVAGSTNPDPPIPQTAEAPAPIQMEEVVAADEPPKEEQFEDTATAENLVEEHEGVSEDLIVAVDNYMTSLIDRIGFDATVDAYDAEEVIAVNVVTKQPGLFIGQKGETIDAIQYLLNVAVYKERPFAKRIVVDSEGYRQRRVEALQGMAHRTARRAVREGRPLSLPSMSAAERRVVHLFLKENPTVTTSSEGEEEDRWVVVSPN